MSGLQTATTDAKCTNNSIETTQFKSYINSCRTPEDLRRATTFIGNTIEKYVTLFDSYRSQFTDLMISADGLNNSMGNADSINQQISGLQETKNKLKKEIEEYRVLSNNSDKTFLEDIYYGTPKKLLAPTVQDITLLIFWFSWLIMSIVLIIVRTVSEGGGWKSGLFSFVILLLVTVCIFAILQQVA